MQKVLYLFFLLLAYPSHSWAQQASVKGRVIDALSNEPMPFVNVIVSGSTTGTVTDTDGNFSMTGLSPGFIRLQASFVGYHQALSSEFEINNARVAFVEIRMEQSDTQIDEVVVTTSPFRKTEESPVSLKTIGIAEIEKSPGANRDISKVIQSYAGVLSSPSFRNDIIIRGGGPSESRFYLDGVEVPNINHFATQGASGGAVGILNADLIREVNYYSGAFPSNRGNALSGVFEFAQVDGNSDKLKFKGSLGASEVSATVDGPLSDKTTFIVSARRSYLKLLFTALKLPFLPTFNDMQFKVRTRFNAKNELTFIGLGAIDQNELNLDIKNPDDQQKYILSQLPVNNQWSYTLGAVYKHFRKNSYQALVVSRSQLNNTTTKYLENDESSPGNKILDYTSQELENKIRFENNMRMDGFKANLGLNIDFVRYSNTTLQKRFYDGNILNVNYDTELNLVKYGVFGQISHEFLASRLTLSAGFRMDANNYSLGMNNPLKQFSPRISASYQLTPEWSLNLNTGRYFQLPAYTTLGYRQNNELVNKNNQLKYLSVDHFIGGLEFKPVSAMQFSLEGFLKNYRNYPFSVKDRISLANKGADYGVIGDEEVTSTSKGRAYGAEFQARISSSKGYNLNLSYTLVRSEFQDGKANYFVSAWDSKHILSLTGSAALKRSWQLGTRFRFVGGLPFTPFDLNRSSLISAWNLTGGPYLDNSRLNSNRFGVFHQLDVRIDKSYYLKRMTLKFYLDIQNLYNYQSQSQDIVLREVGLNGSFLTTDNGTRYVLRSVKNTSGTVLPTIGVQVEF
ncbi:MAG TPA: TonB-dependent receptor [Prolixibacteraceae bacterium]|nr:TonB-dependent receptor [Prolixibacteraceae bacterium]